MNTRQSAISALQTRLGYQFQDQSCLEEALSHASLGQGLKKVANNERLEFLGDRLLNLMVAEELMRLHPDEREGELSKRLHVLVSRETCARVARSIDLGPALRLPGGETRRGARDQDTVLADAMEAIIAALYLEAGLEGLKTVFQPLWQGEFCAVTTTGYANPKSDLQEWAAAEKRGMPRYEVVGREGPDHAPTFTVEVTIEGFEPARAVGRSRQEAEKGSATALLKREGRA